MEINYASVENNWPKHDRLLVVHEPTADPLSLVTEFPNPFLVFVNAAESNVVNYPGQPYAVVTSEDDLFNVKENAFGNYDTLVIVGVDRLQKLLLMNRLLAEGRTETKIEDWGWLANRMNAIVGGLTGMPWNVIMTSRINSETSRPALQGQFGDQIHQYIDHAFELIMSVDLKSDDLNNALSSDGDLDSWIAEFMGGKGSIDDFWKKSLTTAPLWSHSILADHPTAFDATYQSFAEECDKVKSRLETVSAESTVVKDMEEAAEILQEIFEDDFSDLADSP